MNHFNEVIKTYLDNKAESDPIFAKCYSNPEKNIEDCCKSIVTAVKKTGRSGFSDFEVFSMAVNYYMEKDVDIEDVDCTVVTNEKIELTEEEKDEARKNALLRFENEEFNKLRKKEEKKKEIQKEKPVESKQIPMF